MSGGYNEDRELSNPLPTVDKRSLSGLVLVDRHQHTALESDILVLWPGSRGVVPEHAIYHPVGCVVCCNDCAGMRHNTAVGCECWKMPAATCLADARCHHARMAEGA